MIVSMPSHENAWPGPRPRVREVDVNERRPPAVADPALEAALAVDARIGVEDLRSASPGCPSRPSPAHFRGFVPAIQMITRLNFPSPSNAKKLQLCMSFFVPSFSSPM